MQAADPSSASSQPQIVPPPPGPAPTPAAPSASPSQPTGAWRTRGEDFEHLVEPIEQAATRYGSKVALRLRKNGSCEPSPGRTTSRDPRAPRRSGPRPAHGDRVVMHAENSPDWIVACYAVIAPAAPSSRSTRTCPPANSPSNQGRRSEHDPISRRKTPSRRHRLLRPAARHRGRLTCEATKWSPLAPARSDPDADPALASINSHRGNSGRPKE
jgi:hypothetical protein